MPFVGLGGTGPALAVTRATATEIEALWPPLGPALPTPEPQDLEMFQRPGLGNPPALERPVLFVHGYNSGSWVFNAMSKWMAGPGGTTNPQGGTVRADTDPATLDPKARLFSLEFSKPWQCAEVNADELTAAIEAVSRATGSPRVDVVSHSMGGLDARVYLDRGGDKIGKLAMVAPPNHGSFGADVVLWLRDEAGIAVYPHDWDPDVREALVDLRAQKGSGRPEAIAGAGNPFLRDLNRRWKAQRARTMDVAIMVGGGSPTPKTGGGVTLLGDGFVPWSSSSLPGIPMRYYFNPLRDTHGRVLRDSQVAVDVANFLVGADPDRVDDGGDGVVFVTSPSA